MAVKSCSSDNAKEHVMFENETPKNLYGFGVSFVVKLFSLYLQMYICIYVYDTVFRIYGGVIS